jgi:hypothetical protein
MAARRLAALVVAAALVLSIVPGVAAAKPNKPEVKFLRETAAATWNSFVDMTDDETGLTSDNLSATGMPARYTSPTNIGSYLWSTIAARDLGIITEQEAHDRMAQTLATLATMERSHGQYFNWYDPETGEGLTTWPADGSTVYPFLSSVDNGWLAAALMMVRVAEPSLAPAANAILEDMDFSLYYDNATQFPTFQLRGGAWTEPPPNTCTTTMPNAPDLYFTCHTYGTLNTEPRIASYIGIALGQLPAEHYYHLWRTFPDTCDWGWQEQQPQGEWQEYMGVQVFEGTYGYRDLRLVPSWGGSMFEALMVPLLVPEEEWAPDTWGVNHPTYVEAQIEHGLKEARYGYWGFSPANDPAGGYREYGVDPIGLNPDGYTSDVERTTVDYGFDDCRPAQPAPDYGQGVVTPHASFLALDFDPKAAIKNLRNLDRDFGTFNEQYGWYDSVNVETGQTSQYFLALDQGMIMAAIANRLTGNAFQDYFANQIQSAIQPVISLESWDVGRIEE